MTIGQIVSTKENLKRILNNLKIGIIAHDLNRHIFFFNEQAEKITGYRQEEVLGKDCHQVFGTPFCGEHCAFCDDKSFFGDKAEYATTITTKNGEVRRIEMTVSAMNKENGALLGVLASFKDITDLLMLKISAQKLNCFSNIIGQDNKMIQVFQQISDVADYDFPVHISGETGTGKELVARAIHNESHRAGAPFVPINCGALPEGLIESELFGHVKGAFSGAIRDKKGRFELAHKGTMFLDEVSELSRQMQVKLLRFLQEGTFEKVGGEKTIAVRVRVISATNKDLKNAVQEKRFRDDLFYRLNVIPIHLPPLRERKNDIPLLANHLLKEACERFGQGPLRISKGALSMMMEYHWPGNVRELQNAIQFAIVKCRGFEILPDALPLELRGQTNRGVGSDAFRKLDIESVQSAMARTGGNKSKSARLLGVGRATLYRFLNAHPEVIERVKKGLTTVSPFPKQFS